VFDQEYTLEEISYSRKEDRRIIKAVLKRWFNNPKELNFVSPELSYPFNFDKWLLIYENYDLKELFTIIVKFNEWIIGHVSFYSDHNNVHIFHLFIDPKYRNKGLAKRTIKYIEIRVRSLETKTISMKISPKNLIMFKISTDLGYRKTIVRNQRSIKMSKELND
tara:strand:- start:5639 stop:6130 length:492 start_codon:yes stop_codon:yes gene_type:complete